jgi:hypothetical protein
MSNIKTLRVCLSEELPSIENRDPNFIYFLYDKLTIYIGQNLYYDPYVVAESIPENPAYGIMYILLDGTVKAYIDNTITKIATIESEDQIEILKKTGTMFFVNSDRRYLDLNRRVITLPFNNGTYELTVGLANELKFDENTVIGYNKDTNTFEIIGERDDYNLVFTRDYRGSSSNSAEIEVSEHKVSGNVKVSKAYDNEIKVLHDGLYLNAAGKVTKQEFNSWVSNFDNYKSNIEKYMRDINQEINDGKDIVSEDTVSRKILSALEAKYPEIESDLAKYNELYDQMQDIETNVKKYADDKFAETEASITASLEAVTNDQWEDF